MGTRFPGGVRALGNGHCVIETAGRNGRPIAHWHPLYEEETREPMARVRERLVEKYGEERTHRMADVSRNLIIYPNLVIKDIMAITVRYFEPIAPDHMEVRELHLALREESVAMLATRLDIFLTILGPGGFATPDDVEALESCQIKFLATVNEWSDTSRDPFDDRSGPEGQYHQHHLHCRAPRRARERGIRYREGGAVQLHPCGSDRTIQLRNPGEQPDADGHRLVRSAGARGPVGRRMAGNPAGAAAGRQPGGAP